MAATAIGILTSIAFILLVGMLLSILASKINFPDTLFLILFGMLIGAVPYKGEPLIAFPHLFLTSISILALAIIVFDSASSLRLREFDTFSFKAVKLSVIFLIFCAVLLTVIVKYLFDVRWALALLFSFVMAGTSPEIVLTTLKGAKHKAIEVLKIESIFNTPLTVLLPFIVIDLLHEVKESLLTTFIDQIGPFIAKFAAGIGSGILVGIILFKLIKGRKHSIYVPMSVIVSALLTYVLAENIGGSGVLAVTTLGLFIGNVYKKEKQKLLGFESLLAKSLYILVFMLIGIIIQMPIVAEFFIKAGAVFLAFYIIRFITVWIAFRKNDFNFKEKLFLTLSSAKGIAVAVVAFALATFDIPGSPQHIPGITLVLRLILLFMVFSIIVSTVATRMSKFFIGEVVESE